MSFRPKIRRRNIHSTKYPFDEKSTRRNVLDKMSVDEKSVDEVSAIHFKYTSPSVSVASRQIFISE